MDLPRPTGRRAPSIEALEPRLLFSGDAAGAAVAEAIAWAPPASAAASAVAWTAPAAADTPMQAGAPRELAVVDARVPDVGRLLQSLDAQRAAGRPIDVLVLGAGEDALQVLDAELAASDVPYRAVHFFGHGTAGSMQLGATSLDLDTVRANAGSIAGWSDGLTADADLLLWGCDTGAGAAGAVLLDALADLTGADVAASDDATGGLSYGADWTLEVVRGPIEAQAPIEAALQASFAGVLAAEASTGTDAVVVPADSGGRQLAGNASGSVAVWVDATSGLVVAQRYDAVGAQTGTSITVSAAAGRAASVAMDADGGEFIVVWQHGTGATGQILAQRFSATGVASGSPLSITADATDNPMQPAIAMNAAGDAVVVWAQEMGNGGGRSVDLVYRRISLAGVLGDVTELSTPSGDGGTQSLPSVAMQSDGGFAVAFLDANAADSIQVVVVADATDPNNGINAVQVSQTGQTASAAPSIAVLADGNYIVVWSASTVAPTDATVQGAVIDVATVATGVRGTVFQVSQTGVTAGRASVAVAPGGTTGTPVVVWEQDDADGLGLRGRFVSIAGSALGAEFAINQATAGAQRHASAAFVNGALQVRWTGPSADTVPVEQTWVRTIAGELAVTWPTVASTSESDGPTGGTTLQVALTMPPDGEVTVRVTVIGNAVGANEATVYDGVLVFDASNWYLPQTVTIRGNDESRRVDDGDQSYTVRVAVDPEASIATWDGVAAQERSFQNIDNDTYSEFVVTTLADIDDVTRPSGAPLTPYALWLHEQNGNAVSLREALLASNFDAGSDDQIQIAPAARGPYLAGSSSASAPSVAVWVDATTNDVVAQRYDAAGVAVGALIEVSGAGTDGRNPSVAMDPDGGGFIVVWQTGTSTSGQLLAQRYLPDGTASGGPLQITSGVIALPSAPTVAMNAHGEAVVVWAQDVVDGANQSVDLVYRRISSSGVLDGATNNLLQSDKRAGIQMLPAVAMREGGGFGVTYMDTAGDGSVWVVAVPDSGAAADGQVPQRISAVGAAVAAPPSIAVLSDGRYVVAWSGAPTGAAALVQAVVVGGDGVPGTAFQVSDAAFTAAAGRPSVTVAHGGGGVDTIVVAWQQDNGSGADVRARAFTVGGVAHYDSVAVSSDASGVPRQVSAAIAGGMLRMGWTGLSSDPIPVEQTFFRTMSVPTQDIVVVWPTSAVTSEADGETGSVTLQVSLAVPPVGMVTVVVTVSDAGEAAVFGGTLTFDANNWNVPQTVTIRGLDEARPLVDGDRTYSVSAAIVPADSVASWHGVAAQTATFTNTDTDTYSEFVVDTIADVDDVLTIEGGARMPGSALTPRDLWLHQQAGGTVSLREALLAANYADEAGTARDTITFALGAGTQRITLVAALHAIVHAVDIDGGAPATPGGPLTVELTRTNSVGGNGLVLDPGSDGSRIAHLSIGGFGANAVLVRSSGNTIEGNHLGVDASGTAAFGNGERGLSLHDDEVAVAVADNILRDNVIGSNEEGGIRILGGEASGNVVQGNFIGTDRSLTRNLGNGFSPGVDPFGYGILLTNGAHDNLIGGTVPIQQNVLRHNGDLGIVVGTSSSSNNALIGNVIDADATPIERRTDGRSVPTPILSEAGPGSSAGSTTVRVSLDGPPGATYRLDFYVDRSAFAPGSTQPVDALTWISGVSTRDVQLGGDGTWSGTVTLSTTADYTMAVVATATWLDTSTDTPTLRETSALSNASRVNQVPVFELSDNLDVNENTDADVISGSYAVSVLRATDPDVPNGPLIWRIVGGADSSDFTINAVTGVLSFNVPPDFENPQDANASDPNNNNSYEVFVQAEDVLGGQSERRYVVRVNNLNERPTVVLPAAAVPATEDTDLVMQNATGISVRDPDRVSSMQRVVVELSVDRGTLALGGDLEDVSFRDGTTRSGSRIVISGDLQDIQDALERIGYRPVADDNGRVTLTIKVSDRDDATLTTSGSVQIAIAAVNDAPVVGVVPPDAPINLRATAMLALDESLLRTTDVDDAADRIVYTMRAGPLAGQLLRDGVEIRVGGSFTQAEVNAGRMSFMAPTQGGMQQLSLAVTDGSNASATHGPIVLKLSVHSHAAASMSTSASSVAPGGAGAGQAYAGVAAAADGGTSGADGGSGASARAGGSGAAAPAQSAAARAGGAPTGSGAGSGTAAGAAPTSGAIATQSAGVELQAARSDASGSAREASGAAMNGGGSANALGAAPAHSHDETERLRSATGGTTAGALADAWRRAGAQQLAEPAAEIQQAWSPVVALRQADFRDELAQSREEATSKFQASSALVASSVAISTSLSLGYAIWLLRGGVLLTSLLASMPAWRSIDPLPVLARIDARGQDDDDEDDSLRGLLQRAADAQAERVAEAEALADRAAAPAGRLAEGIA